MDGANRSETLVGVHDRLPRGEDLHGHGAIDPEARYRAHRDGKGAAFTRANPPVALLRSVAFKNRSEACRAEAALKKLPREKKLAWAKGDS